MLQEKINKQLLQSWNERVRWIMSADFSMPETPEAKQARIERARKDYSYFVKTYFPHIASKPCGKFHIEAAKYLLKNTDTRAVFEWARGHAKSSHLGLLIPLWLKIQIPREINVMVLVSKSQDAAIRLLADLQAELEYNEAYKRDFGEQVKAGSWADGEFRTTDGCMFVALGRGQSPRGLKDRAKRPDYIVIDDIDDDEMVRNPRRVKELTEWCLTALAGTMAMGRGRFVLVGNRIAKTSVLAQIAERPNVFHTRVNALDKNGNPAWGENYTPDEIRKLRDFIGERNFQKEYMNNPLVEGAIFMQKHIKYGKMLDLKYYKSLICYTDPSFKNSATADYKATVLAGKTQDGHFHILKCYADICSVSAMVDWHYQLMRWVDGRVPVLYYIEANFMQDLLIDEFKKAGDACGLHVPIRGDKRSKGDKFARIEAMQPLFERGLVILNEKEQNEPGMKVLEEQLLLFEKGSKTHDDAPDALESAIWLLSQRARTSTAQFRMGLRPTRKW